MMKTGKTMKNHLAFALILLLISSTAALAHTKLKLSKPVRNAMLSESPKTLELNFDDDVRLIKLSVVNSKKEKVNINFKPSMDPSQFFTYQLTTLMPSKYKVAYTIMGEDGHKMKGGFSFNIRTPEKIKAIVKEKDNDMNSNKISEKIQD